MLLHVGKPGSGVRVFGGEVQELVQVALLSGDFAAEGVDQLVVQADVADDIVRRVLSEAADDGNPVVEALFYAAADGRGKKLFRGDVIDILLRGVAVDAEDIDFIPGTMHRLHNRLKAYGCMALPAGES